jgi:NAD+ synthase (glutamine-hydrolysing)
MAEGNRTRIALAQINTTVGDLDGNSVKIIDYIGRAKKLEADLVAFPELATTGYPPEDLLLRPSFLVAARDTLSEIAQSSCGITVILGTPDVSGQKLYNGAAILADGEVKAIYHKIRLPNYGVFDELRYFSRGSGMVLIRSGGFVVAPSICEDIWTDCELVRSQHGQGAVNIAVNISCSPYHVGKAAERRELFSTRAEEARAHVCYVNLIGGQDELIFDGQSMVADPEGEIIAEAELFQEEMLVVDIDGRESSDPLKLPSETGFGPVRVIDLGEPGEKRVELSDRKACPGDLSRAEEICAALILGVTDYVGKNGFEKVVIGVSGGIDSSLTAAIAADALGARNVVGVWMPSRYSSDESREDTVQLAETLGIDLIYIPIDDIFQKYLDVLAEQFRGTESGIAEENIQARIRGNLLMALSNKFGWLVLTTGNKSEVSVGYSTLYGDTAGGFAVLKDVPKTLVYELSRHLNEVKGRPVIPERVLTKAPSAELRPDQTDQDSLPPYDLLDSIIEGYVEKDLGVDEIVELGYPRDAVEKVARMVDTSEYKRRQAPPGVRITPKAFGKDRRMPITNRYKRRPRRGT